MHRRASMDSRLLVLALACMASACEAEAYFDYIKISDAGAVSCAETAAGEYQCTSWIDFSIRGGGGSFDIDGTVTPDNGAALDGSRIFDSYSGRLPVMWSGMGSCTPGPTDALVEIHAYDAVGGMDTEFDHQDAVAMRLQRTCN